MFSLVTACMNREAHLRRSLPAWLNLPGLAEVVIVDWSNAQPLFDLATLDSRVRVIRAEGEERWILSYAYNLGLAHATHDAVLKCDADCVPTAEAVSCLPEPNRFFAGHWRSGHLAGKPSVNGQCFVAKAHFERVNGYSEIIRTYGRDDEDFYDRLQRAGVARAEIPAATLNFLDHSHEERVSNQFAGGPSLTAEQHILRDTTYNEMRNYYLATLYPWGPERIRAAYARAGEPGPRCVALRRDRTTEFAPPPDAQEAASLYSLRYLVGKILRLPASAADKLERAACIKLLAPRIAKAA